MQTKVKEKINCERVLEASSSFHWAISEGRQSEQNCLHPLGFFSARKPLS